jgi:hypothetical protein
MSSIDKKHHNTIKHLNKPIHNKDIDYLLYIKHFNLDRSSLDFVTKKK